MPRMRCRPGLRPGPRWGSSRRSPRPRSRLGRGKPPPQEPHPSRRLRRLDSRAFGARSSAPSAPRFWRIPTYIFSNTPLVPLEPMMEMSGLASQRSSMTGL